MQEKGVICIDMTYTLYDILLKVIVYGKSVGLREKV